MNTRNNPNELFDVVLKFIVVGLLFLAGFFLSYLESISV